MLWLTLRQHRMQMLVTTLVLLGLGGVLLGTGIAAADFIAKAAPPGCPSRAESCADLEVALGMRYGAIEDLLGWLPLIPGLIGVFWGAPVVAGEFERRTHTFVWSQTVSRPRWLLVKLGLLSLFVVVGGLAFGAMVSAWLDVFEGTSFGEAFNDNGLFTVSGVVPAGWWLFMFTVGTAAGALFRKLLPAMAVTIAIFVLVLFGLMTQREMYAEPARTVTALSDDPGTVTDAPVPAGASITHSNFADSRGNEGLPAGVNAACERAASGGETSFISCVGAQGYRQVLYYQPPERYWRFQWTEMGILFAGALGMGGLTASQALRRRP